ncbi:LamG domain-containing protein [Actinosynnema pretiosum subsp. pretiosum]|uniref:LamG domain-containing protein n=1 Tax=Actinosynnema pretiosum subsp. pretiosum TaxID=103721 RepID=A0AA45R502_9PSEU|nr:LamG domain-containing protein [Actinosynnema pretiosum subsp. pretiosum]
MLVPVAPAVASPGDPPKAETPTEAPDEVSAASAARAQGSRVEIADQRAESRTVFAEPDGSRTAEFAPEPVRVRRGGDWAPVDTTLEARPDGTVAAKATTSGAVLSGGGAGPLAKLWSGGRSMDWFWPGELPEPVLDASVATYPEVLDGIDLQVRATAEGFVQHPVVKNREAAANPALASIRQDTRAEGLDLKVGDDGAAQLVDGDGVAVFATGRSLMWDTPRPPQARAQADEVGATPNRREATVDVRSDGTALVLAPDQDFLSDPLTSYPVVIDPAWHSPGVSRWAVGYKETGQIHVGDANAMESNKDGSWNGRPAKVGHTTEGNWTTRSYFQFDTGALSGADIASITFSAPVVWSYAGCSGASTKHELWRLDQSFDGLVFDPAKSYLQTADVPAVHGGCTFRQAAFTTSWVNTTGPSGYLLKAQDGLLGGDGSWHRYDPSGVRLFVTYNRKPDAPAETRTDPPLTAPCRWCDGVSYTGSNQITLKARLTDPDNDPVKPVWTINGNEQRVGPTRGSGNWFEEVVDLSGRDGQRVTWSVRGDDGTARGSEVAGPGPFVVDRARPAAPTVAGGLYKDDGQWRGGVDVPDDFAFGAAGSANVDHYRYGWQDPPSARVDATSLGGPATVRLAPERDGPQTLSVQSVSRGGRPSDTVAYRVHVRAGNGPRAHYSFEGNLDDDAFLGDRDAIATGQPEYSPGAVGSAVWFGALTATAVASVETDKSFTVTAWAWLDRAGTDAVVVSQDGARTSGFRLGALADGRWAFALPGSDDLAAPVAQATSARPARTGAWVHLAGVHDAATGQVRLYVDGKPEGAAPRASAFNATGSLRLNGVKADGKVGSTFPGGIDDLGVYDRVLDVGTITGLVAHADVRAGHWSFGEGGGTTAGNSASGGQALVLSEEGLFSSDGAIGGGLRLDGGGNATTSGPVVRTDDAFSIAAWVRLDPDKAGQVQAVVSQDGTSAAGLTLHHLPTNGGRWAFTMARPDGSTAAGDTVISSSAAKAGEWTHVAGVYDATSLRIYVNGLPAGAVARTAEPWNASGPLRVGCVKRGTATCADPFSGNLDELRVYSRPVSEEELKAVVAQANVTEGWWKLRGDTVDSSGRGRNGTPHGAPGYTAGGYSAHPDPKNLALSLNGETDAVTAPRPIDTDKSFSVAAWVKLRTAGQFSTVVSQDGQHVSGFFLQALADGRWAFSAEPSDVPTPTADVVASAGLAQVDTWTHLVGVHDAPAGRIELYVNGVLAGSAAHRADFNATGDFAIGRAKWDNRSVDYFPGAIGDVRAYNRVLFGSEVVQLAGRDLSLVHGWNFDDDAAGSTAADSVGGRAGALVGGATLGSGRVGGGAVFNGTSGAVSTTGVDLRTDKSFTVSTWVWLNDKGPYGSTYTAVGLDGGRGGKFQLGHEYDPDTRAHGDWFFTMPESAESGGAVTKAAVSTDPTEINSWVHLTGVYDASIGKLWLYVNGYRVGDGTLNTPWNGVGPLQIGRGVAGDGHGRHWPGRVDEVRIHTGTLDSGRVSALYDSFPSLDPPAQVPAATASWNFDETSGEVAEDAVGDNDVTLRGGAARNGGRAERGGWFDGIAGHAESARPAVHTDRSFSVTGWAYNSQASTGSRALLSQDGERVSAFKVHYDNTAQRWAVSVAAMDQDDPETTTLLASTEVATGHWTHLAVVYDAPKHHLGLYLNGLLVGSRAGVTLFDASGPLVMGRAKWNGKHTDFFLRGVDDVRAFDRALTPGEVRAVHDDVISVNVGSWLMDDAGGSTARDSSQRGNDFALSGRPGWGNGPIGGALRLNGQDVSGVARDGAGNMLGSRTVSLWAKLTDRGRDSTALAQDGKRVSGFLLQYRAEADRWVFALPERDDDDAPLVGAVSDRAPVPGAWTHLTGVYDHAARQLRLYVDGRLAGVRDGAVGWLASQLTLGRGKRSGTPADHFAGELSEVRVEVGVMAEERILRRGLHPAPAGGQLGRFVNAGNDRHTVGDTGPRTGSFTAVPQGYRFDAPLGLQPDPAEANTRTLYACRFGADGFTSLTPDCEGQEKLGIAGTAYNTPPAGVATNALYRCMRPGEHFDAVTSDCEGVAGAVNEGLVGHTVAHAPLRRYNDPDSGNHQTTVGGGYPGYRPEGVLGLLATTAEPGTQPIYSCLRGRDEFTSLDSSCEGARVVGRLGHVWTEAPEGRISRPVYRCLMPGGGHLTTVSATCELLGGPAEKRLGYVLTAS